MSRRSLLLLVCLLLAAEPVRLAGHVQEKMLDRTLARLHIDQLTISLSDEVVLTLRVEGPAPLEVEVLPASAAADAWQVRASEPQTTRLGRDRERWQQTVHLEPMQPGQLTVPVPSLRLHRGTKPVTWEPVRVTVTTAITQADVSAAADITSIEPAPPPWPWLFWALVTGASVAALTGLALGGWLLSRRRERPAPPPPPDQWALRELERIDALGLPAAGQSERYHTLLSEVIRHYLDLRIDLHPAKQTTAEFLKALRQSARLPQPAQEQLREFLERCDLAKFAPVQLSPEECRAAADLARTLVEQTAALPSAPPSTGASAEAEPRP